MREVIVFFDLLVFEDLSTNYITSLLIMTSETRISCKEKGLRPNIKAKVNIQISYKTEKTPLSTKLLQI